MTLIVSSSSAPLTFVNSQSLIRSEIEKIKGKIPPGLYIKTEIVGDQLYKLLETSEIEKELSGITIDPDTYALYLKRKNEPLTNYTVRLKLKEGTNLTNIVQEIKTLFPQSSDLFYVERESIFAGFTTGLSPKVTYLFTTKLEHDFFATIDSMQFDLEKNCFCCKIDKSRWAEAVLSQHIDIPDWNSKKESKKVLQYMLQGYTVSDSACAFVIDEWQTKDVFPLINSTQSSVETKWVRLFCLQLLFHASHIKRNILQNPLLELPQDPFLKTIIEFAKKDFSKALQYLKQFAELGCIVNKVEEKRVREKRYLLIPTVGGIIPLEMSGEKKIEETLKSLPEKYFSESDTRSFLITALNYFLPISFQPNGVLSTQEVLDLWVMALISLKSPFITSFILRSIDNCSSKVQIALMSYVISQDEVKAVELIKENIKDISENQLLDYFLVIKQKEYFLQSLPESRCKSLLKIIPENYLTIIFPFLFSSQTIKSMPNETQDALNKLLDCDLDQKTIRQQFDDVVALQKASHSVFAYKIRLKNCPQDTPSKTALVQAFLQNVTSITLSDFEWFFTFVETKVEPKSQAEILLFFSEHFPEKKELQKKVADALRAHLDETFRDTLFQKTKQSREIFQGYERRKIEKKPPVKEKKKQTTKQKLQHAACSQKEFSSTVQKLYKENALDPESWQFIFSNANLLSEAALCLIEIPDSLKSIQGLDWQSLIYKLINTNNAGCLKKAHLCLQYIQSPADELLWTLFSKSAPFKNLFTQNCALIEHTSFTSILESKIKPKFVHKKKQMPNIPEAILQFFSNAKSFSQKEETIKTILRLIQLFQQYEMKEADIFLLSKLTPLENIKIDEALVTSLLRILPQDLHSSNWDQLPEEASDYIARTLKKGSLSSSIAILYHLLCPAQYCPVHTNYQDLQIDPYQTAHIKAFELLDLIRVHFAKCLNQAKKSDNLQLVQKACEITVAIRFSCALIQEAFYKEIDKFYDFFTLFSKLLTLGIDSELLKILYRNFIFTVTSEGKKLEIVKVLFFDLYHQEISSKRLYQFPSKSPIKPLYAVPFFNFAITDETTRKTDTANVIFPSECETSKQALKSVMQACVKAVTEQNKKGCITSASCDLAIVHLRSLLECYPIENMTYQLIKEYAVSIRKNSPLFERHREIMTGILHAIGMQHPDIQYVTKQIPLFKKTDCPELNSETDIKENLETFLFWCDHHFDDEYDIFFSRFKALCDHVKESSKPDTETVSKLSGIIIPHEKPIGSHFGRKNTPENTAFACKLSTYFCTALLEASEPEKNGSFWTASLTSFISFLKFSILSGIWSDNEKELFELVEQFITVIELHGKKMGKKDLFTLVFTATEVICLPLETNSAAVKRVECLGKWFSVLSTITKGSTTAFLECAFDQLINSNIIKTLSEKTFVNIVEIITLSRSDNILKASAHQKIVKQLEYVPFVQTLTENEAIAELEKPPKPNETRIIVNPI